MNRREFIKTSASFIGASALAPGAAQRKPNVIFIASDDHGYAEIGVQGCKDVPTPNIDSIARSGVRFTDGYVSCPVCSPTRAGWTTGRYQQRFGHEFNPGPAEEADRHFGLPLTEVTLANRMKQLGYSTGMVGKWHLGYRPEFHPLKRGFDEYFGFLGGAHPYLLGAGPRPDAILRGAEPAKESEYLTDAFAREAVAYIDRRRKDPFFLYLAFNAVHNPAQATEKYLARFSSIQDQRRRTFAAMLSALDDSVGRVLSKLRETGLEDNTLIFFVGDNGGPTPNTTSRNDPLRGYKGQVLEGGIRVPFLMQWKGRLRAGSVYRQPVIALDVLPTAVTAGGGDVSKAGLDGVDLLPYVTGQKQGSPHQALYWRFGPQSAIRKGDWKTLRLPDGAAQLYNLAEDVGESRDLATTQPARLKELQTDYDAWNRQLAAPRWSRNDRPAKGGKKARRRR
ncbi:MAG: sulfatase-like hydrolase/transferase [Acidobacteriota bacterium]